MHLAAPIEVYEFPQKLVSIETLLVHSCAVDFLAELVVDGPALILIYSSANSPGLEVVLLSPEVNHHPH